MQDFDPCPPALTWVDNLCRYTKPPPPTKNKDHKHQSAKDRAHNRPGIPLDITNIDLPNIDSLHNFNSLPNSNILDKYKALADDKIFATQILKTALEWVENIVGEDNS